MPVDSFGDHVISFNEISVKKKLGEGAFGVVCHGYFKKTEVAVKQLAKERITQEDIEEFMAEAKTMKYGAHHIFTKHTSGSRMSRL